jgi:hypothetical protein
MQDVKVDLQMYNKAQLKIIGLLIVTQNVGLKKRFLFGSGKIIT